MTFRNSRGEKMEEQGACLGLGFGEPEQKTVALRRVRTPQKYLRLLCAEGPT